LDKPLPATAQVASQEGRYLGRLFNKLADTMMKEKQKTIDSTQLNEAVGSQQDFHFVNKGFFTYVGHEKAAGQVGPGVFTGAFTYLLWRSVYLTKLISLRNRTFFMMDWLKVSLFGRDITRSGVV